MNIVFWVLQALVAVAFGLHDFAFLFRREQMQTRPQMEWVTALPDSLVTFIGIAEILGAVGLILPALTGILPWLTPLAAALLALVMLLAIGFHLMRGEYRQSVGNLLLGVLAAAVAYGRFVVVPF